MPPEKKEEKKEEVASEQDVTLDLTCEFFCLLSCNICCGIDKLFCRTKITVFTIFNNACVLAHHLNTAEEQKEQPEEQAVGLVVVRAGASGDLSDHASALVATALAKEGLTRVVRVDVAYAAMLVGASQVREE